MRVPVARATLSAAGRSVSVPGLHLRGAVRGTELVARAIAEPAPTDSSADGKASRTFDSKRERKPKREVTLPWADVEVGKQYKGVVVRARPGQPAHRPPGSAGLQPATGGPLSGLPRPPASLTHSLLSARQARTTEFGAFINIGTDTDGLAHISQLSVRARPRATPAFVLACVPRPETPCLVMPPPVLFSPPG